MNKEFAISSYYAVVRIQSGAFHVIGKYVLLHDESAHRSGVEYMREKEYQLLRFIGEQDDWVTASQISRNLDCSVRTVKTYVSNINAEYAELITSSREGFLITEKNRLYTILNTDAVNIPQTAEGRMAYILKTLLLNQQEKDLDVLAEELCISPITLSNEIGKIKASLGEFDLVFKTKNNCAYIAGLEKNKKKIIAHLIHNETKDFFSSMELLQTYLPNIDLKIIKHVVSDTILQNQYFIDDFSLLNFILHIGITMERSLINSSNPEHAGNVGSVHIPAHITLLLQQICEKLEQYFPVHFTENECNDLSLILMTRIMNENIDQMNVLDISKLQSIVGEEICDLVEIIQKKVRDTFNINLNNHDFIIRFALHLRNMLIRMENDISLRNPQLLSIKNTYPYIYDISVFIANIITQEKGMVASEDEISYIAIHIGMLIEEQKALLEKVKVVILCPNYYSSQLKLVKRIHAIFDNSVILSGIITSQDELDNCLDYDCIISTVPIKPYPKKPHIQISGYFTNKDIGEVVHMIDEVNKDRAKTTLENKLKYLFNKDLFFYNPPFQNQNDAIEYMSKELLDGGYVDVTFKDKLYKREAISSSAYTNIAIPHPLEMCSKSTAIAISIHPKGIDWNGTKVSIIFMLAIKEEDRILFRNIFEFVTELILNNKYFDLLLNTKTYDEFIHLLLSTV